MSGMTGRDPATTLDEDYRLLNELVHAAYWLDDGLQAYMRKHSGMSLPRAQSMMMVYISDGVDRPADLAKRLRVSKQSVQQSLKELMAKNILALDSDPDNRRQKIIHFTERGRELRNVARRGISCLHATLAQRIGSRRMRALRDALEADWGGVPGEGAPTRKTV